MKMKKIIAAILCGLLLLSLAACGGGEKSGDTMSAEEILNGLYEGAGKDELPMGLMTVQAEGEMFEYFFFIPEVAGAEAWVSEPGISSIAHSVGVIRLPEDADAEDIAAQIEANMNPSKWLCVTAEKAEVICHGQTILLVMSSNELADLVIANFDALWE